MAEAMSVTEWPKPWERRGLWLLLFLIPVFGVVVEHRSAFLHRRMGDLGVYLRGAWAARQGGEQLYTISCDGGWHYVYPPLLAILLAPLADPPAGVSQPPWSLPYKVSVGVWYLFSVLCVCAALHALASALERHATETRQAPPPCVGSRLVGAAPVAATGLPGTRCRRPGVRGQVTPLLLALLCAAVAADLRGRKLTAGLWLAGAICLKIIPAFLLLVPIWRRDGCCLAGCTLGLVIGLGVIPLAAFGPTRTVGCYRDLGVRLLGPALGMGDDKHLARELIQVTGTDSQSFLSAVHNTGASEAGDPSGGRLAALRRTHWLLGSVMTLLTLLAFRHRPAVEGTHTAMLVGALTINMILVSPVCHLHYFAPVAAAVDGGDGRRREPNS